MVEKKYYSGSPVQGLWIAILSFVPSIYYSAVIIPYFLFINPFSSEIASIIINSSYFLSCNSYAESLENLV